MDTIEKPLLMVALDRELEDRLQICKGNHPSRETNVLLNCQTLVQ